MPQFVIDLDRYERVGKDFFRNRATGKVYTPRQRNGRVELALVIAQQPQRLIATRPTQLALPAPRYVQAEEEEKSEPHLVRRETKDQGAGKTFLFILAFVGGLATLFALATPVVVHHIMQPVPAVAQNAAQSLARIDQLDRNQYNAGQYDVYSQSACSAASLTEAFNAWGGNYRISVVLGSEVDSGIITSDLGLVDTDGITKIANRFGFNTQSVSGLDQAISTANAGSPVVVDLMPGAAWPKGHFIDIVGGDGSSVKLADSWSTNFTQVDKARFLRWNPGQMWAISPSRYSLLQGHPTLSADQVNTFFTAKHSPMAGQGQLFVDLSNQYHVDDAYVVATFDHESQDGMTGEARDSKSPGNLRCAEWITWGWCQDNYEFFHSWDDGLKALYILLSGSHYMGAGRNTPEMIVPLFAPQADNNNETGYIDALKTGIDVLRSGRTQI